MTYNLLIAGAVGVLASFIGVALSRPFLSTTELHLSTGGIVVKLIGALFAITVIVKEAQKLLVNHHLNPKYKEQNYV